MGEGGRRPGEGLEVGMGEGRGEGALPTAGALHSRQLDRTSSFAVAQFISKWTLSEAGKGSNYLFFFDAFLIELR